MSTMKKGMYKRVRILLTFGEICAIIFKMAFIFLMGVDGHKSLGRKDTERRQSFARKHTEGGLFSESPDRC